MGLGLAVVWVVLLAPTTEAGILDLAWDAPTTDVDGAPLTDLWGYRVYSGISSLTPCPPASPFTFVPSSTSAPVSGTVVTYRLRGLTEGATYFVQVTSVDFIGNESGCSNEATGIAQPDPSPSSESGGSGCFIATAAFGSPLAQEVQVLREFRDRALLTQAPGRAFVTAYYYASPPLAELIRQHQALRVATRSLLWPVVWWAHLALASPALALALGGAGIVAGPLLLARLHCAWRVRTRGRAWRMEP